MPTRVAMVQGTPDQVQRATQMINEIVEQVCVFIAFLVTKLAIFIKVRKKQSFFGVLFLHVLMVNTQSTKLFFKILFALNKQFLCNFYVHVKWHAVCFFSPQSHQRSGGSTRAPVPSGPGIRKVDFPVPASKCGLVIGKGNAICGTFLS